MSTTKPNTLSTSTIIPPVGDKTTPIEPVLGKTEFTRFENVRFPERPYGKPQTIALTKENLPAILRWCRENHGTNLGDHDAWIKEPNCLPPLTDVRMELEHIEQRLKADLVSIYCTVTLARRREQSGGKLVEVVWRAYADGYDMTGDCARLCDAVSTLINMGSPSALLLKVQELEQQAEVYRKLANEMLVEKKENKP